MTALQTCCVNIANAGGYFFSFMARKFGHFSEDPPTQTTFAKTDGRSKVSGNIAPASRMSEHLFFPPFIVLSSRKKSKTYSNLQHFCVLSPKCCSLHNMLEEGGDSLT